MLTPTRIYVKPILRILRSGIRISGLAHITGSAFTKLARIGAPVGVGFEIDYMPKIPPILELIQREGNISPEEMYRTFNMGIGFCICTPQEHSDEALKIINDCHMNAHVIGRIIPDRTVTISGRRIA